MIKPNQQFNDMDMEIEQFKKVILNTNYSVFVVYQRIQIKRIHFIVKYYHRCLTFRSAPVCVQAKINKHKCITHRYNLYI